MDDTILPLFEIITIEQLRDQFELSGAVLIDCYVGYDSCAYLLFSTHLPERIVTGGGIFVNTEADSSYIAVELVIDWENQCMISGVQYHLGNLHFNFHYLRPIGDHFLLLGARCRLRKTGAERNGFLITRDGVIIKELCFGDGIEDCIVTGDNRIITSYFDEGIYGNYGWDVPIGHPGLLVWNEAGEIIWKNKNYCICDCYAMSIDKNENLYFYYYTEFPVVKTDFTKDTIFMIEDQIRSYYAFSVNQKQNKFLFAGGYNDPNFYLYSRRDTLLKDKRKVQFMLGENEIFPEKYYLLSSKHLYLSKEGMLYGFDFY